MTSLALAPEHQLLREYAITHDPQHQEELVRRFMPLARALALRYRGTSEQTDDLMQVASLGLVKALNGFDPDRGSSFKAYAAPTILGELRRHFRDRVWTLRLPRGLGERTMAISEASQRLSEELGRAPTVAEITKRVELSEEEVTDALQAVEARKVHSLDAPASREDVSSVPIVETVGAGEPGYERVDVQLAAEGATLSDVERTVLKLRFEHDLTQYEIGRRIGVSQMQISRIMRRALRKLLDEVVSEDERGGETAPTVVSLICRKHGLRDRTTSDCDEAEINAGSRLDQASMHIHNVSPPRRPQARPDLTWKSGPLVASPVEMSQIVLPGRGIRNRATRAHEHGQGTSTAQVGRPKTGYLTRQRPQRWPAARASTERVGVTG